MTVKMSENESVVNSKSIDLMKEYENNPEQTLLMVSESIRDISIYNIPCSYDLSTYPMDVHYNRMVSVYGTVMKLGLQKFKVYKNSKVDYQEIKIQERSTMYLPRTINVQLYGQLINTCKPGEVIRVAGVVEVIWHKIKPGQNVECEYSIRAVEITRQKKKENKRVVDVPVDEYNLIMEAIDNYAPSLAGLRQSKFALILCTIGGQEYSTTNREKEGTVTEQMYNESQGRNRVSSHILLVGRTGTGKSTLLSFAAKTVTPSVRTTGNSCTSAGLTACATRENNDWMIEPGAIPQADRGLCCIDEFNNLRKEEKASILEAMEQQTISIAKAGILLKLDTRCTVIGAARHSTEVEGAVKSLKLSPPLLSRFDLIMGLDEALASDEEIAVKNIEKEPEEKSILFISELIEERKKIRVKLSDEAKKVIELYYKRLKKIDNISIRALESHIRLCEAYTKLVGREVGTKEDALMCTLLLNSSLNTKKIWNYTLDAVLRSKSLLKSALQYIEDDLLKN